MSSNLMGARADWLRDAAMGLKATNVDLVGQGSDGSFEPLPVGDDLGLYMIVPRLANALHMDAVPVADGLLAAIAILSAIVGSFFVRGAFPDRTSRVAAIIVIWGLAGLALLVGDVYSLPIAPAVAFVPAALTIYRLRPAFSFKLLLGMVAAGFLIGVLHVMRGQAAVAAAIPLVLALLLYMRGTPWRKILVVACLCIAALPPLLLRTAMVERRDAFLSSRLDQYVPGMRGHPIWYVVYMGLGYLDNAYQLKWGDQAVYDLLDREAPDLLANKKSYQIDPAVMEPVLSRAVWAAVLNHPYHVARVFWAKAGVMAMFFVLACNIWLPLIFRRGRPTLLDGILLPGVIFAAIPGMLAIPVIPYVTGFVAMSALYAVAVFGALRAVRSSSS